MPQARGLLRLVTCAITIDYSSVSVWVLDCLATCRQRRALRLSPCGQVRERRAPAAAVPHMRRRARTCLMPPQPHHRPGIRICMCWTAECAKWLQISCAGMWAGGTGSGRQVGKWCAGCKQRADDAPHMPPSGRCSTRCTRCWRPLLRQGPGTMRPSTHCAAW